MPSRLRTSAGTETCPCAVTFDWASAMTSYYHGNARPAAMAGAPGEKPPHP